MEGVVRFATRAGILTVGAGILSELCLYDGKSRHDRFITFSPSF
jgi:hypothetical protein